MTRLSSRWERGLLAAKGIRGVQKWSESKRDVQITLAYVAGIEGRGYVMVHPTTGLTIGPGRAQASG